MKPGMLFAGAISIASVDAAPLDEEALVFTGDYRGYRTNAFAVYFRRQCWGPYATRGEAAKALALVLSGYRLGLGERPG